MEVSAKTGLNIKEFFKDLAYMIAVGNKKTNPAETRAPPQPAQQPTQNNNIHLTASGDKESGGKKKKQCCG